MLPLLPILPHACPNIGGLLQGAVRLWPAANVSRYPAPVRGSLEQGLELLDAGNYADVYFLDSTAAYDEEPAENEQGLFYKVKLGLVVAANAPDAHEAVNRLAGGRYLVAFQDGNGQTRLAGTPEWPLRLLVATETGRKPTDRNGLLFTFAGEVPARAPLYPDQNIQLPASRRRAFSAGFNFGFS